MASANVLVNNDYYKFKDFNNLLKTDNFAAAATYDTNQKTANMLVSMEALLPSFQFTWGNNLGFGFSARLRGLSLGNEISSDYQKMANNELKLGESITDAKGFSINANIFSDVGIHGAYKMIDNADYSMSLGLGLKMYTGVAHTSFTNNGYSARAVLDPNTNGDYLRLTVNDWVIMSNIKEGQEIKLDNAGDVFKNVFGSGSGLDTGKGFGGDIGVEFLVKNSDINDKLYKAKFGFSVHDIGRIRYKNIEVLKVTGTGQVNPNELQIQNINELANYLRSKNFIVSQSTTEAQNISLPTSLNAYLDVPLSKMFYISANTHINLAETKNNNPAYNNQVGIVPRLETKWFDVAVPISYNFMSKDVKPGLAFRVGPLSVGSDDLKLLVTNAKGANLYAGLGFLLYKPKKEVQLPPVERDRDGDGVLDKDDACPDVAGPVENQGCPYTDKDGDGVLDKDDACPTVAGPKENNGCPWADTDGDGIFDKDDACPTVFGLKEYKGCPKPQETLAQEATLVLRDILFNYNAATLRPEAEQKIVEAAKIIKTSNGGTFLVIGHTDKKGNDAYNLKLSRERAAAVVRALEAKGVNSAQLKSQGKGETEAKVSEKASNAERMADRRVEVKYVTGADWDALQKSDIPAVKKAIKKGTVKKTTKKTTIKKKK